MDWQKAEMNIIKFIATWERYRENTPLYRAWTKYKQEGRWGNESFDDFVQVFRNFADRGKVGEIVEDKKKGKFFVSFNWFVKNNKWAQSAIKGKEEFPPFENSEAWERKSGTKKKSSKKQIFERPKATEEERSAPIVARQPEPSRPQQSSPGFYEKYGRPAMMEASSPSGYQMSNNERQQVSQDQMMYEATNHQRYIPSQPIAPVMPQARNDLTVLLDPGSSVISFKLPININAYDLKELMDLINKIQGRGKKG